MRRLGDDPQRGRPDIAHLGLLAALGSPLNLDGHLRCIVHTREDKIIRVNPKARLPRNTDRFVSLLEQLYEQGHVPITGIPLLALEDALLSRVVSELNSELVIALSTEGEPKSMMEIASMMTTEKEPIVLVGGFSSGHFSRRVLDEADSVYRIDKRSLEAWTVVARAIYDYERTLPKRETMLN